MQCVLGFNLFPNLFVKFIELADLKLSIELIYMLCLEYTLAGCMAQPWSPNIPIIKRAFQNVVYEILIIYTNNIQQKIIKLKAGWIFLNALLITCIFIVFLKQTCYRFFVYYLRTIIS